MGSFFTDILSFQHETAVFDVNPHQLRFVYNTYRFTTLEEIKDFEPELVINAVTVKYTLDAFRQVLPVLPKDCIISDIASVKTGLKKFYDESGFRYVSTHPMFGPTFASLNNLNTENAIIISEGDHLGKIFFKDLYQTMKLNIFEYTFDEHDETVAYSLSIPFVSTFVFAAVMKHQEAPGTTFKKHMAIAKGLLSEDDYLLQEILFNPRTPSQVENIRLELKNLLEIISNKDAILEDAQTKADAIIADANTQAQKIVSESEVMQAAMQQSQQLIDETNAQAQDIIDKATQDSNEIRMSAIRYTDEMLENLEKIMSHTIDAAGTKYSNFINSIQYCYDIVNKNRMELSPQAAPSSYTQVPEDEAPAETASEE